MSQDENEAKPSPTLLEESTEIFIGIVAPTGTDTDLLCKSLSVALSKKDYECEEIRLSGLIGDVPAFDEAKLPSHPRDEYIKSRQNFGNNFRKLVSLKDAVARWAIGHLLTKYRFPSGPPKPEDFLTTPPTKSPRTAYVYRSLKTPEEVKLLRDVYRERFYLIGVYTPRDFRIDRLAKEISDEQYSIDPNEARQLAEQIADRDEYERGNEYGQNVRKTYELSDIFVDASDPRKLVFDLSRFVELMFGNPFITPSRDENGMFVAYASALRSAALGRQVGASIATADGDILSTGTNEVPKYGGGAYWEGDDTDAREFHRGTDTSDDAKVRVFAQVIDRLLKTGWLDDRAIRGGSDSITESTRSGPLRTIYEDSSIDNLIEFAREVHAEMAAIIQASKHGTSIKNSTLYATTFPCHHCTRHIIGVGIKRVVYVSPYPKSLAFDLHSDSIGLTGRIPPSGGVTFDPFVGVSANRYVEFFGGRVRKDKRGVVSHEEVEARPNLPDEQFAYLLRELAEYDQLRLRMEQHNLFDRQTKLQL